MQEVIVGFAKEYIVPIAYGVLWYVTAGIVAALFGKRTTIEAWCQKQPTLALILHLMRKTGFDFWGTLKVLRAYARARAGLPPEEDPASAKSEPAVSKALPLIPMFILFGAIAGGVIQVGCGRASVESKINAVQEVQDQAIVQVGYLNSVFDAAVSNPAIPPQKQLELRQRFAEAHAVFDERMAKKSQYLKEALEANAETIDVTALVAGIVEGVQGIIQVLDLVGLNPFFIEDQRTRAMALSRGI